MKIEMKKAAWKSSNNILKNWKTFILSYQLKRQDKERQQSKPHLLDPIQLEYHHHPTKQKLLFKLLNSGELNEI